LRSYLIRALEHYLANLHERDSALKRGGGYRLISLDLVLAERELPAATEGPQQAYEREWALGLMERALGRLRREYEEGRRKGRVETVLKFFGLDRAPSYAEAAAECGMTVPQVLAEAWCVRTRSFVDHGGDPPLQRPDWCGERERKRADYVPRGGEPSTARSSAFMYPNV
jgi:hypothetical protein